MICPHDVVRVHDGVERDGHVLGGMHVTVTDVPREGELDATVVTGERPIHLYAFEVDLVWHQVGRRS